MTESTQVIVPASPVPEQALTLLRYVLVTIGGVFVSKGWLNDADLNTLVGGLLIVLPTLWGIIRTYRNNAAQKAMARQLPDAVAMVV